MGKQPLWKDFYITDTKDLKDLQSYWQSNKRAWEKYYGSFGGGIFETNLPYSELRLLFRYAIDKPIPNHVSSKLPTWELYKDD